MFENFGGRSICRWRLLLVIYVSATVGLAGTITLDGKVTQSTSDGTGPAVNNPSLNNIGDLESYFLTLSFTGSITAPGSYNLTGLTFNDPTALASETNFGSIKLTITTNGGFDEFSLLGCLTTGMGCLLGNQLDANFKIPAASLNSQNVVATGLDPPHPLDLLEDDGITDIQGTVTTYSYNGPATPTPEPALAGLLGCVLTSFIAANRMRVNKEKNHE